MQALAMEGGIPRLRKKAFEETPYAIPRAPSINWAINPKMMKTMIL
jgi:hypothetical protein